MQENKPNLYHLKIMIKDINESIETVEIYKISRFPIIMAQRAIILYTYDLYQDEHPQIKKLVNANYNLFTATNWRNTQEASSELIEVIGAFCFGSAKRYKYKNLIIK